MVRPAAHGTDTHSNLADPALGTTSPGSASVCYGSASGTQTARRFALVELCLACLVLPVRVRNLYCLSFLPAEGGGLDRRGQGAAARARHSVAGRGDLQTGASS